MTGNVSPTTETLGAVTAGGGAAALLPKTAGNSVFQYLLYATILVASVVLITRFARIAAVRFSK